MSRLRSKTNPRLEAQRKLFTDYWEGKPNELLDKSLEEPEPLAPWERHDMLQLLQKAYPRYMSVIQEKNIAALNDLLNTAVGMSDRKFANPINKWLVENVMHDLQVPFGAEDRKWLSQKDTPRGKATLFGMASSHQGWRQGLLPGKVDPSVISHEAGHMKIPAHSGLFGEENQRWLDSLTHPKESIRRKLSDNKLLPYSMDEIERSTVRAFMGSALLDAGVPIKIILEGLYQQGQIEE